MNQPIRNNNVKPDLLLLVCELLQKDPSQYSQQDYSRLIAALNNCPQKELVELVRWHRIALPLGKQMLGDNADVADWFLQALKRERRTLGIDLLAQQAVLANLSKIFDQAGLSFIAFKGVSLSVLLYEVFDARHSKDVDIWIEEEEIQRAIELLIDNNFKLISSGVDLSAGLSSSAKRVRKDLVFVSSTQPPVEIELHWRLEKNRFAHSLSFKDVLRQSSSLEIATQSISTFSLEQYLLYLPIHGGMAMWGRLKWLYDWYCIVQLGNDVNYDWDVLARRLESEGRLQATLLAFMLSKELFEQSLPAPFNQLVPSPWVRLSKSIIIHAIRSNKYPNLLLRWVLRLLLIGAENFRKEQFVLAFKMLINPNLRK